MYYSIKGQLCAKFKGHLLLRGDGGVVYDILTPENMYHRVDDAVVNDSLELYLYYYLDMQGNRAFPVMIGFLNELEKDFFEVFISVSGIGPRAAVKALARPISEVARAIEKADVAYLKKLPGIGTQKAKNVVASLQGRMSRFMLLRDTFEEDVSACGISHELMEEATAVLTQLQYTKKEAAVMIEKAFACQKNIEDIETLLSVIYANKGK